MFPFEGFLGPLVGLSLPVLSGLEETMMSEEAQRAHRFGVEETIEKRGDLSRGFSIRLFEQKV